MITESSDFVGEGAPLTQGCLRRAAELIGCSRETVWTVLTVETALLGFLQTRQPRILFERHRFSELTGGIFDATQPSISNPIPGGYGADGEFQFKRLALALGLNKRAALMSASWGMAQIMGENFSALGFATVSSMVETFMAGEDEHVEAMAKFIVANGKMRRALVDQDFTTFARIYNGPAFRRNKYDERMAVARNRISRDGLPDLDVRAVQVRCWYAGLLTQKQIDCVRGPVTDAAEAKLREMRK